MNTNEPGSVAHTVRRLSSLSRRKHEGLIRVEYESEWARQRVVQELADQLNSADLSVVEIDLPVHRTAAEVTDYLTQQLVSVPEGGVASIVGFSTAFTSNTPLIESLRVLNFNRDRLAQFPVCQIWWLTPQLTDLFLQVLPDLNSWFLVRLQLTETVSPPAGKSLLPFETAQRDLVGLPEAKRRSEYLVERFDRALKAKAYLDALEIAVMATMSLWEAGLRDESAHLAKHLLLQVAKCFVKPSQGALLSKSLRNSPESAKIWERLLKNSNDDKLTSFTRLGRLFQWQNYQVAAASLFIRRLMVFRTSHKKPPPILLDDLASTLWALGEYDRAVKLWEEALEIEENTNKVVPIGTSIILDRLAKSYIALQRYDAAHTLIDREVEIAEKYMELRPRVIEQAYNRKANLLYKLGRFDEALHYVKRIVDLQEKQLGTAHPSTIIGFHNYADLLNKVGRNDEAQAIRNKIGEPNYLEGETGTEEGPQSNSDLPSRRDIGKDR